MLELIGKKVGMSHIFKDDGNMIPVTLLELYSNCVVEFDENTSADFNRVTMAFDKVENNKKIAKPQAGFFNKKSVPLFRIIHSSKLKKGSQSYKVGDNISIDSVTKEGDKVNIQGVTIGKGFAGVMKRWNFRGLEASHGVSISHRSHGSTGQRQDPGKTFRGKKMAGHMGVKTVTMKNLEVVFIDKEKSLVGVSGSVPGYAGSEVILKVVKKF